MSKPTPQLDPNATPFYPSTPLASFPVACINARSLRNKSAELSDFLTTSCPLVVCITETWLCPQISLSFPGYECFRRDRPTSENKINTNDFLAYGGVAILVKSSAFGPITHRTDLHVPQFEATWVEISPSTGTSACPTRQQPIQIAAVYRPPSTDPSVIDNFYASFQSCLTKIRTPGSPVLIMGDFNAKCSTWYGTTTDTAGHQLSCLLDMFSLQQHVTFSTHRSHKGNEAALDLMITDTAASICEPRPSAPLGQLDHSIVLGRLCIPTCTASPPAPNTTLPSHSFQIPDFSQFDISSILPTHLVALNESIAIVNWHAALQLKLGDPNRTAPAFYDILHGLCSAFLPTRSRSSAPRRRTPSPPWLTRAVKAQLKRKRDSYSLYRKYPTPSNHEHYKCERNRARILSREAHRQYVSSISTNPSSIIASTPSLFKFVKQLRSPTPVGNPIITELHENNTVHNDPTQIANALNRQFISFGTPDDPAWSLPGIPYHGLPALPSFSTTPTAISQHIRRLKPKKAAGADGISHELLKALSPSIAIPLSLVFNQSFVTGIFPDVWKAAVVVPIYKNKGSKLSASNYRPISLLSTISKLCERVAFGHLYQHVNPVLDPSQSGFRRGDSTAWQLLRLVQKLYECKDQKQFSLLCFFDLSKAFDTVWTRGLLHKLAAFGVAGTCLQWLTSYLTERRQSVRIGHALSAPLTVHSGVPQGSILGPLLFIVYVNDLAGLDHTSLYADDTALHIIEPGLLQACDSLQYHINQVVRWMSKWKLRPNVSKTAILCIPPRPSSDPTLFTTRLFTFPDDPIAINIVKNHKHLGIFLDEHLSWDSHVTYIEKRVCSAIGCISPHISHLHHGCRIQIYHSYVLPLFDYCSLVWSSGLSSALMHRLEVTHRKLLRLIFRMPPLTSSQTLYILASSSPLSERFPHSACKFIHRIKLQLAPPHALAHLSWFNNSSRTRCSLHFPLARSSILLKSPLFKSYSHWSRLPQEVKSRDTFAAFCSILPAPKSN